MLLPQPHLLTRRYISPDKASSIYALNVGLQELRSQQVGMGYVAKQANAWLIALVLHPVALIGHFTRDGLHAVERLSCLEEQQKAIWTVRRGLGDLKALRAMVVAP